MELTLACAAWRFWSFAFRTISGDGSRELARSRELLPLAMGLRATAEEDSIMDADIEVGVCHLLDRSREFLSPPRILVYVRSGGLGPRHETGARSISCLSEWRKRGILFQVSAISIR